MKRLALYALLIAAMLLVGVCLGDSSGSTSIAAPVNTAAGKDIADTFAATGLEDALEGFTVFAPTDTAFEKMPKDQIDTLVANKAKLSLLNNHVDPNEVMSTDFKNRMAVRTFQGENLTITGDWLSTTEEKASIKISQSLIRVT